MKDLIYYFDLGNTRGKLWRHCAGHIETAWAEPHQGDPAGMLGQLPSSFDDVPGRVIGLSVLGAAADDAFSAAAAAKWGCQPLFARSSRSFRGLVTSAYADNPERLGVDRWLGLIGAAGECDVLCVAGCGTALTIDVLAGTLHRGGYIVPGLSMMERALLQGTSEVRYGLGERADMGLGTCTASSVRNGALAAAVALIEKVAREVRADRLVLTGGDAATVAASISIPCTVDPELLLRGMMRYFEECTESLDRGMPPKVGEQ